MCTDAPQLSKEMVELCSAAPVAKAAKESMTSSQASSSEPASDHRQSPLLNVYSIQYAHLEAAERASERESTHDASSSDENDGELSGAPESADARVARATRWRRFSRRSSNSSRTSAGEAPMETTPPVLRQAPPIARWHDDPLALAAGLSDSPEPLKPLKPSPSTLRGGDDHGVGSLPSPADVGAALRLPLSGRLLSWRARSARSSQRSRRSTKTA